MFRKLRLKFTIIQIGVIALILTSVFSVIYFTTKEDVKHRVDESLKTVISIARENNMNPSPIGTRPIRDSYVIIYMNGTETVFETNTDFTDIQMEELYTMVDEKLITFQDEQWESETTTLFQDDMIIFINVTEQYEILDQLLITLVMSGVITLIFFTFISMFFAYKAIKPIEEGYNAQKEFVENASHELRTPLAIMNSNIDILLNYSDKSEAEKEKWLKLLKEEVKNMTTLSNNLLFLTKTKTASLEEINLSDLIKNKLLMYDALLYENKITLNKSIEDDVYVKGINTQLVQLFTNLCDNAIKYSTDESFTVNLYKKGGKAVLKVSNKTDNLNEENIKHLMERFYKVEESRTSSEQKSFGLGLTIAKAIVENHSGKIVVELNQDIVTFKVTYQLLK